MAIFLDAHLGSELPIEAIRAFLRGARTQTSDAFGVTPLDLYCAEEGRVFCVVSAPDEAAIRQGHAAQGVICRSVRRLDGRADTSNQLTPDDKVLVREMIGAEPAWTEPGGPGGDSLRQVS